jgi:hypothetical protein
MYDLNVYRRIISNAKIGRPAAPCALKCWMCIVLKSVFAFVVFFAFVLVVGVQPAEARRGRDRDHVINYSPGGNVSEFESLAGGMKRRGERIVIDGDCYSACAWMFTNNSNVCFTRRARIAFHRPSRWDGSTSAFAAGWLSEGVRGGAKRYAMNSLKTADLVFIPAKVLRETYGDRLC